MVEQPAKVRVLEKLSPEQRLALQNAACDAAFHLKTWVDLMESVMHDCEVPICPAEFRFHKGVLESLARLTHDL